ncbi:MAG: Holliday junction resolvase Hjc [Acidianus infernus]|nr:Holliday junction resolvase Hjc [Acidianus infernus]
MNKTIGRNAERELVKLLMHYGFNAVRIPTSNSSPNPLPDVFATKGNILLSLEVKSTWQKKVKVEENQIRKILDFLKMFPMEGKALIVVKFKGGIGWRVKEVEVAKEEEVNEENSISLEDYLLNLQSNLLQSLTQRPYQIL